MVEKALPIAAAALLATGCGGSEDERPAAKAAATPPAAAPSGLLGEYVQRVRVEDLPDGADFASAGRFMMTLAADSYESFTPKGPGIAGPGRPEGENRYVFEADYRRDCSGPATYEAVEQNGKLEFRAVAEDPCETRAAALTIAPWRKK